MVVPVALVVIEGRKVTLQGLLRHIAGWLRKKAPNLRKRYGTLFGLTRADPIFRSLVFSALNDSVELNSRRSLDKLDTFSRVQFEALAKVFEIMDVKPSTFADIASSNGVSQSAIWPFLWSLGSSARGIFVEYDPHKSAILNLIYSQFSNVSVFRGKVTPRNAKEIMSAVGLPRNLDLLNVDIDSYDLEVLESILASGFQPRVISIEINEKIPPPIRFSVLFDDFFSWRGDHFFGCSFAAVSDLAARFNYVPIKLVYNNALFVSNEAAKNFDRASVAELYETGYKHSKDRERLFRHNRDVEHWLEMSPEDAMSEINSYFSQYSGQFKMGLDSAAGSD